MNKKTKQDPNQQQIYCVSLDNKTRQKTFQLQKTKKFNKNNKIQMQNLKNMFWTIITQKQKCRENNVLFTNKNQNNNHNSNH